MTSSLRTRLTIWYTLTLFVVLGLSSVIVLWQQDRVGLRRVDQELAALNAAGISVLRDELHEKPAPQAAALDGVETFLPPHRLLVIPDEHGQVMAENWNGLEPQPIPPLAEDPPLLWTA